MKVNIKQNNKGQSYIEVNKFGYDLLQDPILNKGTSFREDELDRFKIRGLVPPYKSTLSEKVVEIYHILQEKSSLLEKHIYLRSLQDRNETLFYALMAKYTSEIMPLVYTPVVGEACQKYSKIFRRPRGLFLSYQDIDHLDDILSDSHFDDVRAIVVSDGERILGLGDQGAGGMGIPVGKLSLYTACGGIAPNQTLPILLDMGTDNEERLNDPLYIGARHKRIRGQEYDRFVDCFVKAVKKRFPHVLLQWEDFAQQNALRLLEKYKDQLCTFNDDIQGTASVVLGTLIAAANVVKTPLKDQKIVVVGAGSAGVGISNLIVEAMVDKGLTRQQARDQIYLIDREGLIVEDRPCKDFQKPFAKPHAHVADWEAEDHKKISLLDTVAHSQATMIIGVCGQGGMFTESVIKQMAKNTARPIVFPLSNPTANAEAEPSQIMDWTNDQAVVGTGSPFPEYYYKGALRRVDQVNNSYIFPGMGLGVIAVESHRVTEHMFITAARALASCSPSVDDKDANLLPDLKEVRRVSRTIGIAVAKEAIENGLTDYDKNLPESDIEQIVDAAMWQPEYLPYRLPGETFE